MKIVRHEKRRGNYVGHKTGIDGEYECTLKQGKQPPACSTGSTYSMCQLCPYHKPGLYEGNRIDPAAFGPEVINELLKSDLFKEDNANDPGCGSDTIVIVFGNAIIINRNAACQRASCKSVSMQ